MKHGMGLGLLTMRALNRLWPSPPDELAARQVYSGNQVAALMGGSVSLLLMLVQSGCVCCC